MKETTERVIALPVRWDDNYDCVRDANHEEIALVHTSERGEQIVEALNNCPRLQSEIKTLKNRWDTVLCETCGYYRSSASPCKCNQFVAPGHNERLHTENVRLQLEIEAMTIEWQRMWNDEPNENGQYVHHLLCNSNRQVPIGSSGYICNCKGLPLFKRLLSEVAKREWIPIRSEEDLPKESGTYEVTAHAWGSPELRFADTNTFYDGQWEMTARGYTVIAWRNRPTPYQPEGEEAKQKVA